jgi:hypothetical protein
LGHRIADWGTSQRNQVIEDYNAVEEVSQQSPFPILLYT